MEPGYTGPLARAVRSTGGATYDVQQDSSGRPLFDAAYEAWAGSAAITVDLVYGQRGTGNHLTQPTAANRPQIIRTNAHRNRYGFYSSLTHFFLIPAAITGDGRAFTAVMTSARVSNSVGASGSNGAAFMLGAAWSTAGAVSRTFGSSGGIYGGQVLTSSTFLNLGKLDRSEPQVDVIVSGATAMTVHQNNRTTALGANNAGTWAGGRVLSGGPDYGFWGQAYSFSLYPAALSGAEVQTIKDALYSILDILPAGEGGQLIATGNSIVQGAGSSNGVNNLFQAAPLFTKRLAVFNLGVFGQTAAAIYADRATILSRYDAAQPVNIIIAPEPSNDIDARASGTLANYGADRWNTVVLPFVNAAILAGFKVLVPTTIKRPAWSGSAQDKIDKEAARNEYNPLVRGALPAGAFLLDYAADDAIITMPDSTHPDTPGYAPMAQRQAAAVNSLLL